MPPSVPAVRSIMPSLRWADGDEALIVTVAVVVALVRAAAEFPPPWDISINETRSDHTTKARRDSQALKYQIDKLLSRERTKTRKNTRIPLPHWFLSILRSDAAVASNIQSLQPKVMWFFGCCLKEEGICRIFMFKQDYETKRSLDLAVFIKKSKESQLNWKRNWWAKLASWGHCTRFSRAKKFVIHFRLFETKTVVYWWTL